MKNREIKFRVWDKASNNMLQWKTIRNYLSIWELFDEQSEDTVMQFTGRKDSKGTEIYEGDIVSVNGGNHIIEWRGAGFAATWSDYNLDTCWFVGGGPVVIGNIFENVELAERARDHPKK